MSRTATAFFEVKPVCKCAPGLQVDWRAGCYISLIHLLKLGLLQIVSFFKIRLAFLMN